MLFRDSIAREMKFVLDAATEPWGVLVERVEVKDVRLVINEINKPTIKSPKGSLRDSRRPWQRRPRLPERPGLRSLLPRENTR